MDALQLRKKFSTASLVKMKVGNCKQGVYILLIMFPLRVAESDLDSHPKPATDEKHQLIAI